MTDKRIPVTRQGATAVSAVPIADNDGSNGKSQVTRPTRPWRPMAWAWLALLLVGATDTPHERRARIEAMTPAEKQQLLARQERFERMPPAERERLRRLDEQLSQSGREDELRRVMAAYHDWLKTLSPAEREQLRQLRPAARLARVVELREKEARRRGYRLNETELDAMRAWVIESARAEMTDDERADLDRLPEAARDGTLLFRASEWFQSRSNRRDEWTRIFTEKRIDALRSVLSAEAQRALDEQPNLDGKRFLTFIWWRQWRAAMQESRPDFPSPEAMREKLLDYFENDLSAEDRERLMTLSREQRMQELREKYFEAQGIRSFQPPGPQPGPPSGRPPREGGGRRRRGNRPGGEESPPPTEEPSDDAAQPNDDPAGETQPAAEPAGDTLPAVEQP